MANSRPKIVAVDGPAGSGKSTICSRVALALGWTYLNTGALYRAVGLIAEDRGTNLNDENELAKVCEELGRKIRWDPLQGRLWFGNQELTDRLGSVKAGNAASFVAKWPKVRLNLVPVQRNLALQTPKGALLDGRDIGTVIFPDADLKIFLTASLAERAKRRQLQLMLKHDPMLDAASAATQIDEKVLSETMRDIEARDRADSGRAAAPLKQADDAVVVDTSDLSLDEVVDVVVGWVKKRGLSTS